MTKEKLEKNIDCYDYYNKRNTTNIIKYFSLGDNL